MKLQRCFGSVSLLALGACADFQGFHVIREGAAALEVSAPANVTPVEWQGSNLPELGGLQVGLLYSRLSATPVPWGEFAHFFKDVQLASDEFALKDAMARSRARLEQANAELDGVTAFNFELEDTLTGAYDFERKGWPTSFAAFPMVRIESPGDPMNALFLQFTNADSFAFLPVEEEVARRFVANDLGIIHLVTDDIEVRPTAARKGGQRVLLAEIVRLRVRRRVDGRVLADLSLGGASAAR